MGKMQYILADDSWNVSMITITVLDTIIVVHFQPTPNSRRRTRSLSESCFRQPYHPLR